MSSLRWMGIALALGLAACAEEPSGPSIGVREIQSELTFAPETWDVRHSNPNAQPQLDRIAPSNTLAKQKEDLPALVMAPPAEVRIPLGETTARSVLRTQVGIDREAFQVLRVGESATVAFEVALDDEVVWTGELALPVDATEGAGWLPVGDPETGLALNGAEVLTLRTRLVGEPLLKAPLKAGFGRLQVVEQHTMQLSPATPERPNVVVVVMDTLRTDRTSSGDYSYATTPRLAAFAAAGTEWTTAYASSSWTWPSTASMFTGLLPEEHGVSGTGSSYLAAELDTLAEVMQRNGLATAAFVGNPLIVASQNFDQGFQAFEGTPAGQFRDGPELVPGALDWLRANQEHRFFLYLHMVDPHVPYEPDPDAVGNFGMDKPKQWGVNELSKIGARMMRGKAYAEDGRPLFDEWVPRPVQRYMQSAYDEVVWTGDKWFGKVLDELTALGLDENTVVLFTADHGEELLDHGMVKHAHSLHQELVRVPLVLRGPGVPAGVRHERPVPNRALFETLESFARGAARPGATGVLLHAPEPAAPGPVYFSTVMGFWNNVVQTNIYGVRDGDWVLHFAPDGGPWGTTREERLAQTGLEGKVLLYNVALDPLEMNDLSSAEPDQVQRLLTLIRNRLEESDKRALKGTLASGEGTMDMLKAIGYLDGHE